MQLSLRLSFCSILALIFITLKLTGVIAWSWLWVLSPLWLGLAMVVVLLIIIFMFELINEIVNLRYRR